MYGEVPRLKDLDSFLASIPERGAQFDIQRSISLAWSEYKVKPYLLTSQRSLPLHSVSSEQVQFDQGSAQNVGSMNSLS